MLTSEAYWVPLGARHAGAQGGPRGRSRGGAAVVDAPELKADSEVVLVAVQLTGEALCDAAPELQADREVVLSEVQRFGRALEHAAPELQADREVLLAAVQQTGEAF